MRNLSGEAFSNFSDATRKTGVFGELDGDILLGMGVKQDDVARLQIGDFTHSEFGCAQDDAQVQANGGEAFKGGLAGFQIGLVVFVAGDPNVGVEHGGDRFKGGKGDVHVHRAGGVLQGDFERDEHDALTSHRHLHPMVVGGAVFQGWFDSDDFAPHGFDVGEHVFGEVAEQGLVDFRKFAPAVDLVPAPTQPLFEYDRADIRADRDDDLPGERGKGNEVKERARVHIAQKFVKTALFGVNHTHPQAETQKGGKGGREAFGEVFVDEFDSAHLLFGKSVG